MRQIQKRACVYGSDVARITGKSSSYGRRIIRELKEKLGKQNQFITVQEFSEHSGIPVEVIDEYL